VRPEDVDGKQERGWGGGVKEGFGALIRTSKERREADGVVLQWKTFKKIGHQGGNWGSHDRFNEGRKGGEEG